MRLPHTEETRNPHTHKGGRRPGAGGRRAHWMHGNGTAVGVRGGLWEWQVWGQRGENRGKEVVVGRARPPTCVCYVISHKSCRMPASVGPVLSRRGHLCVLYISVSFMRAVFTRPVRYTTPPLGVSLPTFIVLLHTRSPLSSLRLSNTPRCLLFLYSRTRRAHILHFASRTLRACSTPCRSASLTRSAKGRGIWG